MSFTSSTVISGNVVFPIYKVGTKCCDFKRMDAEVLIKGSSGKYEIIIPVPM